MKRLIIYLLTLVAVACFTLVGCDGCDNCNEKPPVTIATMKLSHESYELDKYDSFTLSCEGYENVTFTSENPEVATVDNNGVVTGISEGETNIVAKNDTAEGKCRVVVVYNGYEPVITVNVDDEISLNVNDKVSVAPKLTFMGKAIELTFSFASENAAVAEASATGEITAKSFGSTAIIITTEYLNRKVEKTVMVNVVEEIIITLAAYDYEIATSDYLGEPTSFTLNPSVKVAGNAVPSPDISYSYDESLLTLSGNVVSAKANRDAKTTVDVIYKNKGEILSTTQVNVTLKFPVIDMSSEMEFYVDNWQDSKKEESKRIGKESLVFPYQVFNDASVTEIYDYTIGTAKNLNYDAASKQLKVDALSEDATQYWMIRNEVYGYRVKINVVDRVIMNAAEFKAMLKVATTEHIVLGADINGVTDYENGGDGTKFSGTLNGLGHTVNGLSMGATTGGLFRIADGATVKNLVFRNVDLTTNRNGGTFSHSLIAAQLHRSTVTNVFAEVKSYSQDIEAGFATHFGRGNIISDVVIVYANYNSVSGNAWEGGSAFADNHLDALANEQISNLYVVSALSPVIRYDADRQPAVIPADKFNAAYTSLTELLINRSSLTVSQTLADILETLASERGDNYAEDTFPR